MKPDITTAESARRSILPPSAAQTALGRRILIVEDDADTRDAMRALLKLWGYDVDVAANGEEGIRLALDRRPNVVVLDVGMPRLDGFDVARRIRAEVDRHQPFLIAFTGRTRAADRQHARDAGFDAYVLKPAAPDALRLVVERALKARA